jgi:hypothetical protein
MTAAIEDVRVMGVTNTQAVIGYAAPESTACSVEVSEEPDYTPLVHDVNATLFGGANLDNRTTSANRGRFRAVVVGKRTIETASNGKSYSRALQAATVHYYRITCGGDTAAGTFVTDTLPLGLTRTDGYIADPDFPGEIKQISVDASTTNQTWIDPHTGVLAKLVNRQQDFYMDIGNIVPSVVAGANWTNTANLGTGGAGKYASYDGANCAGGVCDGILIEAPIWDNNTYSVGYSTISYTLTLPGYGTSVTAADRQVIVCAVPSQDGITSGTTCETGPGAVQETVTLPQGSEGTVALATTFRIQGKNLAMSAFIANGSLRLARFIVRKANGNGSIHLRQVRLTWRGGLMNSVGSGGGFSRCNVNIRPDGFYLCNVYMSTGSVNSFYLIHSETGEVRHLGRMRWYQMGHGFMGCDNDHQPFSHTDPNVFYCQPSSTAYVGEFTYIGGGAERAGAYEMAPGVDFNVRWISTNYGAALTAFYNANQAQYYGILGGAGRYHPPTTGLSCSAYDVQNSHLVGYCRLGGTQNVAGWNWAMDLNGNMIALTPSYATAPHRWCGNHSMEALPDHDVQGMSGYPLTYRSTLVTAIDADDTTLTLTSSCTGDCAGFQPGDPVSFDGVNALESLMPIQVGDILHFGNTNGEYVLVTDTKDYPTIRVERGHANTAVPHSAGTFVQPACASKAGSTQTMYISFGPKYGIPGAIWLWNYLADPFGVNQDGMYVYGHRYLGHEGTRGNRNVNNTWLMWSAPGTQFKAVTKFVTPNFSRYEPLGFAGQSGIGTGLAYHLHPSLTNVRQSGLGGMSWFDGHPFIGGGHFSMDPQGGAPHDTWCNPNVSIADNAAGCPVSRVAGTSYVYRYVPREAPYYPFRPKHFETFGVSGSKVLRSISGLGSTITDADAYTFCIAAAANECRAGSQPGHIYINTKLTLNRFFCTGGEIFSPTNGDACLHNLEWLNSGHTQTVPIYNKLGTLSPQTTVSNEVQGGGGSVRLLVRQAMAGGYRRQSAFAHPVAFANGKWALVNWEGVEQGRRVGLIKIPPLKVDSVNRTEFQPVRIELSSVPAGTDNVVAEFGYSEYGAPESLNCTQRKEPCAAVSGVVDNSNPFRYALTEAPYSGVSCASGCKLTIPALPAHVLYYRVLYRNSSNAVILRGPLQVVAVP